MKKLFTVLAISSLLAFSSEMKAQTNEFICNGELKGLQVIKKDKEGKIEIVYDADYRYIVVMMTDTIQIRINNDLYLEKVLLIEKRPKQQDFIKVGGVHIRINNMEVVQMNLTQKEVIIDLIAKKTDLTEHEKTRQTLLDKAINEQRVSYLCLLGVEKFNVQKTINKKTAFRIN